VRLKVLELSGPDLPLPLIAQLVEYRFTLAQHLQAERGDLEVHAAAPGIPEMLLAGREREFLGQFAFPAMSATPGAITEADIEEFARTYSRPGGWRGAAGLYQSMLREGPDIKALAKTPGLTVPVLAVGAGAGPFTASTMSQATSAGISSVSLDRASAFMKVPGLARPAGRTRWSRQPRAGHWFGIALARQVIRQAR
jgi:hypothetical protein